MYDVILKGGRIIDPSQELDQVGCIAIKDGRIAEIAEWIDDAKGRSVIPLEGKIIAPGLIDLHCHPGASFAAIGMVPDEIGLDTGVTLLVDAGTAGCANFEAYRSLVIQSSATDILCFLNFAATGLITLPEIWSESNTQLEKIEEIVSKYSNVIRGIKIRCVKQLADGMGLKAVEQAKRLAQKMRLPLMVHIGETRMRTEDTSMDLFSRAVVSMLDEGDVLSHYLTWEPGGLILRDGTIYPELLEAKKRGVILDPAPGLNHFSFTIARHAIEADLIPSILTTDLASVSYPAVQSLAVTMSKFINLGIGINEVIAMTTINPARVLGEQETRGSLMVGRAANVTILELVEGNFCFGDGTGGEQMEAKYLLEPRLVFKRGQLRPAHSRYHISPGLARSSLK
jgi:dihydroorotase